MRLRCLTPVVQPCLVSLLVFSFDSQVALALLLKRRVGQNTPNHNGDVG